MWAEPRSVVHFDLPKRITRPEDARPFVRKWDISKIAESNRLFREKWGIDLTGGEGWEKFIVFFNQKLGVFSRLFPGGAAMVLDNSYHGAKAALRSPLTLWHRLKSRLAGRHRWKR
jgi:hypothetical protein